MTEEDRGRPVQVVVANKDHTFTLDEEALQEILMQESVKDKPVVILSVAGAFRKGKSFILSFFIRYLHAEVIASVKNNSLRQIFT
jgi:atlastin